MRCFPSDRFDFHTIRLQLWVDYGYYDKIASEMRALQSLSGDDAMTLRLQHKTTATVLGAALFLRDFDTVQQCEMLREYRELPSEARDEISRIVLPYWADMVTMSHEYLPMIRNYHYGHMAVVLHSLELLHSNNSKSERVSTVKLLVDLSRVCSAMFCFDWVVDDQSERTAWEPYVAYLEGYLELRDALYVTRERMRKVWDISGKTFNAMLKSLFCDCAFVSCTQTRTTIFRERGGFSRRLRARWRCQMLNSAARCCARRISAAYGARLTR